MTWNLQLRSEGHCDTGGHEPDKGGLLDVLMLQTISAASVMGTMFSPPAAGRRLTMSGRGRRLTNV